MACATARLQKNLLPALCAIYTLLTPLGPRLCSAAYFGDEDESCESRAKHMKHNLLTEDHLAQFDVNKKCIPGFALEEIDVIPIRQKIRPTDADRARAIPFSNWVREKCFNAVPDGGGRSAPWAVQSFAASSQTQQSRFS